MQDKYLLRANRARHQRVQTIRSHNALATEYYASFLWMVHCIDYPADLVAALKSAGKPDDIIAYELKQLESPDNPKKSKVTAELTGQLGQTLKEVQRAANRVFPIATDYETAKQNDSLTVVRSSLVKFIGPLALQTVAQEPWSAKNQKLPDLVNPFSDEAVLRQVWLNESNMRGISPQTVRLDQLVSWSPILQDV